MISSRVWLESERIPLGYVEKSVVSRSNFRKKELVSVWTAGKNRTERQTERVMEKYRAPTFLVIVSKSWIFKEVNSGCLATSWHQLGHGWCHHHRSTVLHLEHSSMSFSSEKSVINIPTSLTISGLWPENSMQLQTPFVSTWKTCLRNPMFSNGLCSSVRCIFVIHYINQIKCL